MVRQSKENADQNQKSPSIAVVDNNATAADDDDDDDDRDTNNSNEGVTIFLEGTETIPTTETNIEIEAPSVIVTGTTTTVSEEEEDEEDDEEEEAATTITNHTRTSSADGSYYTDHTRTSSSDGSYYFQSIKSNESLCYSATGSSGSSLTSLLYGTGINNILPNNNNKPASSSYLSHLLSGTVLGGQQRIPSSLFPKLATTDATATKKQQQQQQFSRPQSMLQQPGEGTQSSGNNMHISTLPLHPRSSSVLSSSSSTASPGRHVFPSYYYKYQHPENPDQQQIKSNVYQQRIPYQQHHSIDSECDDSMSNGSSSSHYQRSRKNKNALRCLLSPRVLVTIFLCGVIIDNLLNSGAKKVHQQHRIGNRKYHSCSDSSSVGGDTGLPNCYDDDNTINGDGDDTLNDSWLWYHHQYHHHRRALIFDDSENNTPIRIEKEVEEEEEEEKVVAVVDSVVHASMIPPIRANKIVQTRMAAFSENRARRKRKSLLRSF